MRWLLFISVRENPGAPREALTSEIIGQMSMYGELVDVRMV